MYSILNTLELLYSDSFNIFTIFISSFQHLLNLLIRESLGESSEDPLELRPGDEALSLLVKHAVRLPHLEEKQISISVAEW